MSSLSSSYRDGKGRKAERHARMRNAELARKTIAEPKSQWRTACDLVRADSTACQIAAAIKTANLAGAPDTTANLAFRDRCDEIGATVPNPAYYSLLLSVAIAANE